MVACLERPALDRQASRVRRVRAGREPARTAGSTASALAAVHLEASTQRERAGRALRRDRTRPSDQGRRPPPAHDRNADGDAAGPPRAGRQAPEGRKARRGLGAVLHDRALLPRVRLRRDPADAYRHGPAAGFREHRGLSRRRAGPIWCERGLHPGVAVQVSGGPADQAEDDARVPRAGDVAARFSVQGARQRGLRVARPGRGRREGPDRLLAVWRRRGGREARRGSGGRGRRAPFASRRPDRLLGAGQRQDAKARAISATGQVHRADANRRHHR